MEFGFEPYQLGVVYDKTNQGIFSSDGKPLTLPFSVDSGRSVEIIVKIGTPLDPAAYGCLAKEGLLKGKSTVQQLNDALAIDHLDFFGNPVKAFLDRGKIVAVEWQVRETKGPKFRLTFKTARGSFSGTVSPYQVGDTGG